MGKIYAGLGIVRHPEIVEVKRADFCGEHIGASGPKTNELIDRSLGRILFMDEFYSLVERHQDGRPDMIGMEAVNQLLVALEVHRFDFCFIGAGYEKEVDEFLTVNPGLAGRFNRKLRFASYTPDELVQIAVRYGTPRATVLEPAAGDATEGGLHDAARLSRTRRHCTASTSCRTGVLPATWLSVPSGCGTHGWRLSTAATRARSRSKICRRCAPRT